MIAVAGVLLLSSATRAEELHTANEFWPKLSIHVQKGERARFVFEEYLHDDHNAPKRHLSVACYFEYALRPVFRRELRDRDDVFRRRYLTIRGGYLYRTSLVNGDDTSQNWIVGEFTARYPTRGQIVLLNRNRGEFRFIKGEAFSVRYRNRLWIERDFELGKLVTTPFIYGEVYYDSRFGTWPINRVALGVQIPAGPHVVFEPYLVRQNDSRSTPRHVHALGLTFNLYF